MHSSVFLFYIKKSTALERPHTVCASLSHALNGITVDHLCCLYDYYIQIWYDNWICVENCDMLIANFFDDGLRWRDFCCHLVDDLYQ